MIPSYQTFLLRSQILFPGVYTLAGIIVASDQKHVFPHLTFSRKGIVAMIKMLILVNLFIVTPYGIIFKMLMGKIFMEIG